MNMKLGRKIFPIGLVSNHAVSMQLPISGPTDYSTLPDTLRGITKYHSFVIKCKNYLIVGDHP